MNKLSIVLLSSVLCSTVQSVEAGTITVKNEFPQVKTYSKQERHIKPALDLLPKPVSINIYAVDKNQTTDPAPPLIGKRKEMALKLREGLYPGESMTVTIPADAKERKWYIHASGFVHPTNIRLDQTYSETNCKKYNTVDPNKDYIATLKPGILGGVACETKEVTGTTEVATTTEVEEGTPKDTNKPTE